MEQLLAESANGLNALSQGAIVKGVIAEIRDDEVVIDVGGKSEGVVPASEFPNIEEVQVGDEVDVLVEKPEDRNGAPVISYDKAQQRKNWETIVAECTEGSVRTGLVKGKVKGGLVVSMGIDAFLPASQIDVVPPKNLDQYVGQTYEFKILKINTERKNLVISRRELIEEQRSEKRRALLETIKVGDKVRGNVKNITDYGAFIDLDGLDGLLHITDMSWGRVTHPSEILKVGEPIEVMVTEIDRDRERVSLGLKQCTVNPWEDILARFPIGSKVHGKVVNLVQYGAFVEIEQGVEGLVHVTELSWTKRITKPSDVLKIGQEVDAVILGINKEEQKISLGIRQLEANPWEMVPHNYPVGARVHGKVRNLTAFGAFVELEEGIDGMVHVSDMSWTKRIAKPEEFVKKGQEVEAIVLDVDVSQQRISLGMKQCTEDPWSEIDRTYHIGDIVTGKVTKLTAFGTFVELPDGIDGLVHISQISEDRVEKVSDVLKKGDEVSARVIKIDKDERRIGLSIKAANYDEAKFKAEVNAFDRVRTSDRKDAAATTTVGGDGNSLNSLGDLLDNL